MDSLSFTPSSSPFNYSILPLIYTDLKVYNANINSCPCLSRYLGSMTITVTRTHRAGDGRDALCAALRNVFRHLYPILGLLINRSDRT